jgi:thiol-disulfide isomerase/thioredoxin
VLLVLNSHAQNLPIWQQEKELATVLKSNSARVIMTHYFATWCKPCMEELPVFDSLNQLNKENVLIQFVSLDLKNNRHLKKKIQRLNLPGNCFYLEPNASMMKDSSFYWDGTLPFTVMYFSTAETSIELAGKHTLQDYLKLMNHNEN